MSRATETERDGGASESAPSAEPAGEGVVALENVARTYGDDSVFTGVTLDARAGETLAIIGPSGAGKSTLLRMLGLFDPPDEGRVRIDGTDAWAAGERERLAARRRVGTVFQEANLFDASVGRNVAYGLHVRREWPARLREAIARLVRTEPPEAVRDALETVGLADAARRSAGSLSGGEAQRVAFARALAYDPDVLLLDEPTSDLDPRNTAVIEAAVGAARDRGMAVAIATHDMHQAERVADRVAVLLDGGLVEVGPAERVFEDPDDPRTRKFVDGDLVY